MEKQHIGREHVQHRQHVRRLKAVLADVAPVSYLGAIRKGSINASDRQNLIREPDCPQECWTASWQASLVSTLSKPPWTWN